MRAEQDPSLAGAGVLWAVLRGESQAPQGAPAGFSPGTSHPAQSASVVRAAVTRKGCWGSQESPKVTAPFPCFQCSGYQWIVSNSILPM